jgi:hypothetical protein
MANKEMVLHHPNGGLRCLKHSRKLRMFGLYVIDTSADDHLSNEEFFKKYKLVRVKNYSVWRRK